MKAGSGKPGSVFFHFTLTFVEVLRRTFGTLAACARPLRTPKQDLRSIDSKTLPRKIETSPASLVGLSGRLRRRVVFGSVLRVKKLVKIRSVSRCANTAIVVKPSKTPQNRTLPNFARLSIVVGRNSFAVVLRKMRPTSEPTKRLVGARVNSAEAGGNAWRAWASDVLLVWTQTAINRVVSAVPLSGMIPLKIHVGSAILVGL